MKITLKINDEGKSALKTTFGLVMVDSKSARLSDIFNAMGMSCEKGMRCVSGYVGAGYMGPCLNLTK